MKVTSVRVTPTGTINGQTHHVMAPPRYPIRRRHRLEMSTAGVAKPQHQHLVPPIQTEHSVQLAGQDAYGTSDHCIFVADGHGSDGEIVASSLFSQGLTAESKPLASIPAQMEALYEDFSTLLSQNRPQVVEATVRALLVQQMSVPIFRYDSGPDQKDQKTTILSGKVVHQNGYVCQSSGSTLALMMFITGRHRRWVLTTNVGDSEALLVFPRQQHVHVASFSHSWDSLALYQRYASHCHQNQVEAQPVCYNRWNDSSGKYKCRDRQGKYEPMLMYDWSHAVPLLDVPNMTWISSLHERKQRREYQGGTQSVRTFDSPHLNWGSCVLINGRASGQNMATFGDRKERFHSKVPWDLVHVYIHEIPTAETVVGLVQSDGVSNELTLAQCGERALLPTLSAYLELPRQPKDDMSVVRAVWRGR